MDSQIRPKLDYLQKNRYTVYGGFTELITIVADDIDVLVLMLLDKYIGMNYHELLPNLVKH